MFTSTVPSAALLKVTLPLHGEDAAEVDRQAVRRRVAVLVDADREALDEHRRREVDVIGPGGFVSPGRAGRARLTLTAWPRWLISTFSEPMHGEAGQSDDPATP